MSRFQRADSLREMLNKVRYGGFWMRIKPSVQMKQ